MSLSSKVALGLSVGFTAAIVTYVHVKQKTDRERMREGVIMDMERQQNRKMMNLKMLQDQIELTKVLRHEQEQQDAAAGGSQQQ